MRLEFTRPEFLYLLLLLPLWWVAVRPARASGVLFSRGDDLRRLTRWRWRGPLLEALPRLLRAGAMASLVVALAGPQRVSVRRAMETRGIAIALAVDVSSSMLAEDMAEGTDRLSIARQAAVRFARGRPHDRVGLVAFSGDALTRVPLTSDPDVVVSGVESLAVELVPDGTDIAAAILAGTRRLLDSPREPRVLILLTDGAHNGRGTTPVAAARVAAAHGVRVHAISILGAAQLEGTTAETQALVLANQRRIEEAMETVLSQVARITGGLYRHASSPAALDSAYREIDRREAPLREPREHEERAPLRAWPLLAALSLVLAEGSLRGSRWEVVSC